MTVFSPGPATQLRVIAYMKTPGHHEGENTITISFKTICFLLEDQTHHV